MNQKEIWTDIPGYEGKYQASSKGRVKSLSRIVERKKSGNKPVRERILTPGNRPNKYQFVTLNNKGEKKLISIHRIVAITFLPNPFNKAQVNHKDGNRFNNEVSNLEWCTCQENVDHSISSGLKPKIIGNPVIAFKDGIEFGRYESYPEAAKFTGVCPPHICRILKGSLKTSKGYTFKSNDAEARELGLKVSRHKVS